MRKYFTIQDPVVPVHHPRVLVETAVAHGADRDALLARASITAETLQKPDARISYAQFNELEKAALAFTKDPTLGLKFGSNIHFSHLGVLGLGVMSSMDAESAFRLFLQYYREVAPGWEMDLRVEGKRAFFSLRETISRGDLLPFATEAVLAGAWGLATQALGQKIPIVEARFGYPAPAYSALYAEYLEAPLRFGCDHTEVEFDTALLERRIPSGDPASVAIAQRYFANRDQGAEVLGLKAQVRNVLLSRGSGRLNLEEVARALQTSTRSLRRGLHQMGTSYHAISDEVLRALAEAKMRASGAKLEQIAQELGFSDVRSFRRAFKRWTGQSPTEFRAGT